MSEESIARFGEVDAKPEFGALVVRAVGKSFCAGGDITTLLEAGKTRRPPRPTRAWGRSRSPSTGSGGSRFRQWPPCAVLPSAPA